MRGLMAARFARLASTLLLCIVGSRAAPAFAIEPAASSLTMTRSIAGGHRKYRMTGELDAAIPGLIVHGLGQSYAGRDDRFVMLLAAEVVGLGIVGYTNFRARSETGTDVASGRWAPLNSLGGLLVAGSWIYDLVATPTAVEDWNIAHGYGDERRDPGEVVRDMVAPLLGLKPPSSEEGSAVRPAGQVSASSMVVAVADFVPQGVASSDAAIVSEWVRAELVGNGSFQVVERAQMNRILAEQAFQATGCTQGDCAVRLGRVLNAQRIVVGSLGSFAGDYVINAAVVNVESGQVLRTETSRGRDAETVIAATREVAGRLAADMR